MVIFQLRQVLPVTRIEVNFQRLFTKMKLIIRYVTSTVHIFFTPAVSLEGYSPFTVLFKEYSITTLLFRYKACKYHSALQVQAMFYKYHSALQVQAMLISICKYSFYQGEFITICFPWFLCNLFQ